MTWPHATGLGPLPSPSAPALGPPPLPGALWPHPGSKEAHRTAGRRLGMSKAEPEDCLPQLMPCSARSRRCALLHDELLCSLHATVLVRFASHAHQSARPLCLTSHTHPVSTTHALLVTMSTAAAVLTCVTHPPSLHNPTSSDVPAVRAVGRLIPRLPQPHAPSSCAVKALPSSASWALPGIRGAC